jgi:hypothetical protein
MSTEAERRERAWSCWKTTSAARWRKAKQSGELRSARSYGKPLDLGDGYDETPAELRMGFKMLKDAGVVPAEVELMRDIEALRLQLAQAEATLDAAQAQALAPALSEMQQQLSLRLEKLRIIGGSSL